MAARGVILDFYGTLAYGRGVGSRELVGEARARGHEIYRQEFEAAWNYVNLVDNPRMDLPGWPAFIAQVLRRLGLEPKGEDIQALADIAAKQEFVLYGDAIPALQELRSAGRALAIVTSIARFRLEPTLEQLADLVDVVVTARDVGAAKPNPRLFGRALEKLAADPTASAAVGDEPEWDLDVPQEMGMQGILIDRVGQGRHPKYPTIANLLELPPLLQELDRA